jgi:O-antigen/teichoic acid export membrane protein
MPPRRTQPPAGDGPAEPLATAREVTPGEPGGVATLDAATPGEEGQPGGLRVATARGGVVNAAFLAGAEALVAAQGLFATALLGPKSIGLYGIVTTTAMTIVALRRVGIDEAFVQETAADEEAEFQRALTVELAIGLVAALAIAVLAPVLAAAYDDDRLLGLTLAVTYLPVAFALQAPQWVFFKRMQYVRLRTLQAIVPVGTVAVALPLLLAGVGVWALVIGPAFGNLAAVLAAWRASPYALRLRPDAAAARRYLRFSWPVFVTAAVALIVQQGQITLFGLHQGLVAAGWVTLAATLTRYADRADQILATTIYPAIVRVRERGEVLEELFAKANRLTLLWAFPFGAGLALFGQDLVHFVLGDQWQGAVVLIGGLAVAGALQQVGYNWFSFYRATGRSWPQAVEAAVLGAAFLALAVPGELLGGTWWFVAGRIAGVVAVLAVRRAYLRRLLPGVRLGQIAARAAVPVAVASAAVVALRLALWGGPRPLWQALLELAVWVAALAAVSWRLERTLLAELHGYVWAGPIHAPRRPSWLRVACLWLAAALVSAFTLRRYIGPLDEGVLMQAASRMASGEWPWRDFSWAYGPGEPLLVMAAGKLFAPSLIWWRLLRVAADATVAVLVWALVRRARPAAHGWALAAWAAAALTAAQPTSANPTQPALALALAAVLLAAHDRPAWAGVLAALAGFWRPDIGVCAALAAAVTLALAGRGEARAGRRLPAAGVAVLAAVVAGAVLYAPFAIAAGPGRVLDALVVQSTKDGAWWRLPFPSGFHEALDGAGALKDLAAWLAPYAALLAVALAVVWIVRRREAVAAGLAVLALGAVLYYLSRADEEHAQALLVLACALAALSRPRIVLAAVLALLLAVGAANRASALLRPPELKPLHVAGAGGVRVTPADAAALPKTVRLVDRLVPPGQPIYVAPRRSDLVTFSDPLLHFLAHRPNVLRRDVLLQARPQEQRTIVAVLKRTRPKAIVRWTDPASARPEPNRRGRPSGSRALDAYLATAYRRVARYGDYDVLVPVRR